MTKQALSPEIIERLAADAFGPPNARLSNARELRWRARGSLALDRATGRWFDHEAGEGGGLLGLIGGDRREALARLRQEGLMESRETAAERQERARRQSDAATRRRARAAFLWAQASPLAGSLAERYLREARAIDAPLGGADLRFCAMTPNWRDDLRRWERRPALIARVSDAAGRGISTHVTFLRADGLEKADLPTPRKSMAPVRAGFIRLAPGTNLIVGEGIESTLSAWGAQKTHIGMLGAIAAISAGGMAALAWPTDASALIIAPDRDANEAGEKAALALAGRAHRGGLTVSLMRPPPGFGDWNDAVRARRTGA